MLTQNTWKHYPTDVTVVQRKGQPTNYKHVHAVISSGLML